MTQEKHTTRFRILVLTPAGHDNVSLAIAACRADEIGVFNAECHPRDADLVPLLERLALHARQPYGIKLGHHVSPESLEVVSQYQTRGLQWVLLHQDCAAQLTPWLSRFRAGGGQVVIEITRWAADIEAVLPEVDGWIVKGLEAGGMVGEETTFILLQKALGALAKPVFAHGGIGIHTAAACYAAGAAGVVLDSQMLLLTESSLGERIAPVIEKLVGNETVTVGDPSGATYCRILERPGFLAAKSLRERAADLAPRELRDEAVRLTGWDDPRDRVMPLGQDVAYAADWARRYVNVAGVLRALHKSLLPHLEQAAAHRTLDAGAPLAVSHSTTYPIVQGPMTRVSDTAAFAAAVAEQGGLPMLALALMKGPAVRTLMVEATERLKGKAWGVGFLGFAPADLLKEQVAISREFKPAFAILAGGRPDQALSLEQAGIPSYLHVPTPRLLSMFLEQGQQRFVFEGRECGGHIGPLCGFVLWESMIETLLVEVRDAKQAQGIHVLFAGGIHDARSAAMIAALSAPLAARGMKIGILMGTAYLYTKEIVECGAVVPAFQQEAMSCHHTVCLESGPGHASRCVDTTFAKEFLAVKKRLFKEGKSADEIRQVLDDLNLGRLRLASKGKERSGADGRIHDVPTERQLQEGMYMIGQVATMASAVTTVADLHRSVSRDACDLIEQRRAQLMDDQSPQPATARSPTSDIAIIGIGCALPKANSTREYWENILNKVDAITEIPRERWDWRLYFDADRHAEDKIYSRWGGFMDDMVFDPLTYGIPPNTLKSLDPLQLMSLEVVRRALQDAGYGVRDFDREHTSIILGASGGAGDVGAQYAVRSETPRFAGELPAEEAQRLPKWTEDTFAGILLNVAAGRIANRFNCGGVNFTVDAACASSLAAVYQAVVELEDRRSDTVIVGGVDTVQGPFGYMCFSKTQALSPRGRCSTFDVGADGIVISEGIVMLVMKRLADAERDGDRIYAVIKGAGGSSDGRAKSMTAPHPDGQIRALERAYGMAGYTPDTVDLFEAHGTGTVAGDTAELETVTRLLQQHGARAKQSAIGSVKTLIGHTKASAGVAGLAKAALALHHKVLPPHANVTRPNAKIAAPDSPLFLVREPQPWITRPDAPRRAAVSAFGFGGTNFHITLEEYDGDYLGRRPSPRDKWPAELLVWRAPDRQLLAAAVKEVAASMTPASRPCLRDLAYTLAKRLPDIAGETAALVIEIEGEEGVGQRLNALVAHLEDPSRPLPPGAYYSRQPLAPAGKIALLFAGQGSQYPNMLREVAVNFPDIPAVLETADRVLEANIARHAGGARLSRLIYTPGLYGDEDEEAAAALLTRTEIAQPALAAVEAGLWHLLQRCGVTADMAAGHSFGEYSALYAAGVFTLEDLLKVAEARGRSIVEAASGRDLGVMAAVPAAREEVERIAASHSDLYIANHNAPQQTILSGSRPSVEAAVDQLIKKGIDARILPVGAAFHSPYVSPAAERLSEFIGTLEMHPPRFPVYSNTTAAPHDADVKEIRATLSQHLGRPVEFVAEIEAMYAQGARLFLGLGPKNIQASLVDQILGGREHRVIRIDDKEGGMKGLLHGLGMMFSEGVAVNFAPLFEGRDCRLIDLKKLPDSAVRAAQVPPHAWLLNGTGARRISEPAPAPLTLEDVKQRKSAPPKTPQHSVSTQPPPVHHQAQRKEISMTDNLPPNLANIPWPSPGHQPVAPADGVLAAYMETMRQFLQTQESIMLAYLTGGVRQRGQYASPPPLFEAPARGLQYSRPAAPPAAVAPAHAATPARPTPPPPAPAVAVPHTPPAAPTRAAEPVPPVTAPSTAAPAAGLDENGIAKMLLNIVEERTGYPQDMLGLDQNMEADLGIDSIKRVEIVGALLKALPKEVVSGLGDASQALNSKKTLQEIIDWVAQRTSSQGGAAQEAATRPFDHTGAGETAARCAALPRFIITAQRESVDGIALETLPAGAYLITDDGTGIGRQVASTLKAAGLTPVLIAKEELDDPAKFAERVAFARAVNGGLRGLYHLASVSVPALDDAAPLTEWRSQTAVNDKALFVLLRMLADDLRDGGRIVAATALGGTFARDGRIPAGLSAQGGVVGLLKSLNEEWNGVRVKAVDLDPEVSAADNARALITEMRLPGGRIEVGYPQGTRTVFYTVPAPVAADASDRLQLSREWVVLVTGGARGITAEVVTPLAQAGVHLVILGRTPEPAAEPADTAHLKTSAELRQYLVGRAQRDGQSVTPAAVQRQVKQILRDREIAANLRDFRTAGAHVDYRMVDVCDAQQMSACLDDVYRHYGRIDGVVHGAGIIEDKRLDAKEPESWFRVFDTKADSVYLLAQALRPETLRFVVLFSSVAGRYGNSGQADYAAANELMNRTAWQLHRRWGGTVKVAAINWGPWLGTRYGEGMVSPETRRKFEAMGVVLVPPDGGRRFFMDEIMRAPLSDVEVIAGEGPWEARETEVGAFHAEPALREAETDDVPPAQTVYPLLAGARRRSGDRGQVIFQQRIDLERARYLQQHLLDGTPVLPAAAALEMMAEAAAAGWPGWCVNEVSELRVLRGIQLNDPALDLEIIALASVYGDAGGFEASVELRPAGGNKPPYYRATVHLGSEPLESAPYRSTLQHLAATPVTAHHAYKDWLFHGPTLQTITAVTGLDKRGALADIRPTDPRDWLTGVSFDRPWLFDPGMIDSAPQMAIIWSHVIRSASSLPNRFGRVRRFGADPVGPCRMHFLVYPDQPDQLVKADVAFVDAKQHLRLFIEELECAVSPALVRLGGGWKGEIYH
jgi:acyl transferase domain-containing protein/NAD(P)H-dependent flavin oxidoreductase YrpB (nitropropane dioxygenase family)/NAD(P)-dependent dehydrogenase (short-subunit alcohol dehydrogenase family)